MECMHGFAGEHVFHPDRYAHRLAQFAHQLDRHDAVQPQLIQVSLTAEMRFIDPHHFRNNGGDLRFLLRLRCDTFLYDRQRRFRKRTPIQFAIHRDGPFFQPDKGLRHHVLGQGGGKKCCSVASGNGACAV